MIESVVDVIRDCLYDYFNFRDRSTLQEYWIFTCFFFVTVGVIATFGNSIGAPYLGAIPLWGLIIPYRAVAVRRFHDCGYSGVLMFIPFTELWCALSKGDEGSNRYGDAR